jgi:soluble lytic murein transglycosylase-like protein
MLLSVAATLCATPSGPSHPRPLTISAAASLAAASTTSSSSLAGLTQAGWLQSTPDGVISRGDLDAAMAARARTLGPYLGDSAVESRRALLHNLPFGAILAGAGERNHVDSLLLAAVVEAESQFAPRAVSPCGAVGLMQLLPATGKKYGAADLLDPYANVDAGSRYLRALLDRFKERPDLALAAYNTGPEVVARYGCVPPYRETRDFVRRVLARYDEHRLHLGSGPMDAVDAVDEGGNLGGSAMSTVAVTSWGLRLHIHPNL